MVHHQTQDKHQGLIKASPGIDTSALLSALISQPKEV